LYSLYVTLIQWPDGAPISIPKTIIFFILFS
jgi:hypothetical protein